MFGLTHYGSDDSDSDKSPKDAAPKALQLAGGATLVAVSKAKSTGLLPAFYSDDDDDDDDDGGITINLGGAANDGAIEIVSSPTAVGGSAQKKARASKEKKMSIHRAMQLLPPEPPGPADPRLEAKIRTFLRNPKSFNLSLQGRKDFHNPYSLGVIAEKYQIDQTASNYPTELYDPKVWGRENYERIAREYQKRMLEKSAPVVAAVADPAQAAAAAAALPPIRRKGSKWDQPQPGAVQPPAAKKVRPSTAIDRVTAKRMHAREVANQLSASLSGGIGTSIIEQTAAAKREAAARLAVLASQKNAKKTKA